MNRQRTRAFTRLLEWAWAEPGREITLRHIERGPMSLAAIDEHGLVRRINEPRMQIDVERWLDAAAAEVLRSIKRAR